MAPDYQTDEDRLDAAWAAHETTTREFRAWCEREKLIPTRRETMPKVSEMIVSKFLRKEDFDEDQVMTIKGCKLEQVGKEDDGEQRWVLYFRERDKGMVLNVTTIRVLESAYGDDTDQWLGQKVMVYVDPNVSFGGKVVGGLRLRTPKKQAAAPKQTAPVDDEFQNDVPF